MAISISIQTGPANTNRDIESITVSIWTLHDFIEGDKNTKKRQCGVLRRIDGHSDEDLTSPLADEYLFSLNWGKIVTWKVGRTEIEVSPSDIPVNKFTY